MQADGGFQAAGVPAEETRVNTHRENRALTPGVVGVGEHEQHCGQHNRQPGGAEPAAQHLHHEATVGELFGVALHGHQEQHHRHINPKFNLWRLKIAVFGQALTAQRQHHGVVDAVDREAQTQVWKQQ